MPVELYAHAHQAKMLDIDLTQDIGSTNLIAWPWEQILNAFVGQSCLLKTNDRKDARQSNDPAGRGR